MAQNKGYKEQHQTMQHVQQAPKCAIPHQYRVHWQLVFISYLGCLVSRAMLPYTCHAHKELTDRHSRKKDPCLLASTSLSFFKSALIRCLTSLPHPTTLLGTPPRPLKTVPTLLFGLARWYATDSPLWRGRPKGL